MDDPKPKMLPEVTVMTKRTDPKKYRIVKEKVKIYPNSEVDKSKIDSLTKAGRADVIGTPVKREGMMDMYSPEQGDRIRTLIRKTK